MFIDYETFRDRADALLPRIADSLPARRPRSAAK